MTNHSIGTLAQDAGVSVQTLRHYDRLGLLHPGTRTKAGYRQYSAADRAKLDVIRTLRELQFDLPTIGRLLEGKTSLAKGAELQLRALEHQGAMLRRRASVLRVFLRAKGTLDARRLKQLEILARLERAEQTRFISEELGRRMHRAAPPRMRDELTRLALIELPESPSEVQFDAWLELAELVADPEFLAHYTRGKRRAWREVPDPRGEYARVLARAVAANNSGMEPASRAARRIAERWLRVIAARAGRKDIERFARNMIAAVDSGQHAPERRFWELIAVLRPEIARSPQMVAAGWVEAAVRAWLGVL